MLADHLLGDTRMEQPAGAAVMLMAEDEKVHIEFPGPLENEGRDVVLGLAHHLPVRVDSRGRQPIDQGLNRLAVRVLDVLDRGRHAETRTADNVCLLYTSPSPRDS